MPRAKALDIFRAQVVQVPIAEAPPSCVTIYIVSVCAHKSRDGECHRRMISGQAWTKEEGVVKDAMTID